MRHFYQFLPVFLLLLIAAGSCKSKQEIAPQLAYKRVLEVGDFNAIELEGALDVRIKQGPKNEVVLISSHKVQSFLSWTVEDGKLELEYKNFRKHNNNKFVVFITVKNLKELELEGASTALVANNLAGDSIQISMDGLSKLHFKGAYDFLKIDLENRATMQLEGSFSHIKAELAGNAELLAFDAPTTVVELETSGIALAKINATHKLRITAEGLSRVEYLGNPEFQEFEISGGAKIINK